MSAASQPDDQFLLTDLLRDVSRSFYLTLRVLPQAVRKQIGLAYLLARATDTIADTEAVPVGQRIEALRTLRGRILARESGEMKWPEFIGHSGAEGLLLKRVDDLLNLLFSTPSPDRELIQKVLSTITEGQELDLIRFGAASREQIVALKSDDELDDYTYRVAGCVGEFWTEICVSHLSPRPRTGIPSLIERGISFGKGLQLVNILRDIPADLRTGRCYLPAPALQAVGLLPSELLQPENEVQFRPIYNGWLRRAEEHLNCGWNYVLDLPRSWIRVRLACAWPVLIGFRTITKLKEENVLNPDNRIKVSRAEIQSILRRSVLLYPFAGAWRNLPQRFMAR